MSTIISLLVTGVILLLVEIIIPGGIVGFFGLVCIVAGVIMGFMTSASLGMGLLIAVVIAGVMSFLLWIKYFPKSRVGRDIFLDKNGHDWQGYTSNEELNGKTGIAHTDLRPSGLAIIENRRIDVVSQGDLIEKGKPVKVVDVEGNRVVVAMRTG